jgi:hypothetical protein
VRRAAAILATLALLLVAAPGAQARDPGRWLFTGVSSIPTVYWQGLTSDPPGRRIFFVGVFEGLWRTTPGLSQTAGAGTGIPVTVTAAEGYNHIGDPTWNGDRVLLPMECYDSATSTNTCGTGAFGIIDPATLAWRFYVKLDPAEIPKAMWAETSPDGKLIWTSSGNDLLAYRTSDVTPANAAPAAGPIRAARRLAGAVPPSGVTGAVFRGGRLLLAGERDGTYQVWAVDTRTGKRRLEVELKLCGESEGLDTVATLGGTLHWLIAPSDNGCKLTFGPSSALLHFAPRPGRRGLRVEVLRVRAPATLPGRVQVKLRVTRRGHAQARARVSFAGASGLTGRRGTAVLRPPLELPGRFKAVARKGGRYGLSRLVEVAWPS